MAHSTTVVIERIAGPDAAVSIIQTIVIGVEVALLPCEVQLDDGPHLTQIILIGIILQMQQQLVDVVQVHVVVVHDVFAVGIATDVAVRIHLRTPRLCLAGQQFLGVWRRIRDDRLHIGYLTVGIGIEVAHGAIRHAQQVA